jgi:hypothetical protein
MNWVLLHDLKDNTAFLVNLDQAELVRQENDGVTGIAFKMGSYRRVKESFEEINRLLHQNAH